MKTFKSSSEMMPEEALRRLKVMNDLEEELQRVCAKYKATEIDEIDMAMVLANLYADIIVMPGINTEKAIGLIGSLVEERQATTEKPFSPEAAVPSGTN